MSTRKFNSDKPRYKHNNPLNNQPNKNNYNQVNNTVESVPFENADKIQQLIFGDFFCFQIFLTLWGVKLKK